LMMDGGQIAEKKYVVAVLRWRLVIVCTYCSSTTHNWSIWSGVRKNLLPNEKIDRNVEMGTLE
jgi:hypothetical protein